MPTDRPAIPPASKADRQPDPILELLQAPLARLQQAFADLPPANPAWDHPASRARIDAVLDEVAVRMGDNYP